MRVNKNLVIAAAVIGGAALFLRSKTAAAASTSAGVESDGDRILDTSNDRAPSRPAGAKTSAPRGDNKKGALGAVASGVGSAASSIVDGVISAWGNIVSGNALESYNNRSKP